MEEQLGSRNKPRDPHHLDWWPGKRNLCRTDLQNLSEGERTRNEGCKANEGDWELQSFEMEIKVPGADKEEVKSTNPGSHWGCASSAAQGRAGQQ